MKQSEGQKGGRRKLVHRGKETTCLTIGYTQSRSDAISRRLLRGIVLEISRLHGVTELAGFPTSSIAGQTAQTIERPPDLRGREYGAE